MELTLELEWAVHVRSYPGAPRGGDSGIVIPARDGALAALIDGAGHGLSAYHIAERARAFVYDNPDGEPDALLERLDQTLRGTSGAAISIARLRNGELSFCGIGNVQASLALRPLEMRVGVVGLRMRRPKIIRTELKRDVWFLMHTDGLSSPTHIPVGSAVHVARSLVEKFGSHNDDASVLALRWREPVR